jgi:hypothetical protein
VARGTEDLTLKSCRGAPWYFDGGRGWVDTYGLAAAVSTMMPVERDDDRAIEVSERERFAAEREAAADERGRAADQREIDAEMHAWDNSDE